MFASTMMRLPTVSMVETSRYTGHGSSSVQLIPAHSMSSSVHWNGTSIGLPVFRSTGGAGGSVFGGSAFGSSTGGAMGACAQVAHARNRTATAVSVMLRTILAQPVDCSNVLRAKAGTCRGRCNRTSHYGHCPEMGSRKPDLTAGRKHQFSRCVTVSDSPHLLCAFGTGETTTQNVLLKNRCKAGRQKKNETKPMDQSSYS